MDETPASRGVAAGAGGGAVVPKSMTTPVSPPRKRRRVEAAAEAPTDPGGEGRRRQEPASRSEDPGKADGDVEAAVLDDVGGEGDGTAQRKAACFRSPLQLTAIRDLPASANVDTVAVRDVFGSPHITECWEFNFLHDLDFLVGAFDEGARRRGLAVHVIHGFWKREDPRRESLETAARRHQRGCNDANVSITLHTAFLPEPFGTHHTKMAVLFRDDDTAQVVIHTANMIPHDWANMTQAVWRSPLLPLRGKGEGDGGSKTAGPDHVGHRFKKDFLSYLRAYDGQRSRTACQPLVAKLARYDFSGVRAALVGSVPGRHEVPHVQPGARAEGGSNGDAIAGANNGADTELTQWGWAGLKQALQQVPIPQRKAAPAAQTATAEVVIQVSSIATLGGNDAWLRQTLFAALSEGKSSASAQQQQKQLRPSFGPLRVQPRQPLKPQFRVVFPTADEIRRSLDGYVSGTSIHTKIQSVQQQRQLTYMRPILCHWANDVEEGAALAPGAPCGDAGRRRAAPHVKTYVRYGCDGSIDWALLTSANLSKQAWGEARSMAGEMRIASYELGVLVWPELFAAGATMQPVFGRDTFVGDAGGSGSGSGSSSKPAVPLRIPYSLPLQRYGEHEVPWVGSLPHEEPDWRGVRWLDAD